MGDEISPRSELQAKLGEKRISAQFGEKMEKCKRVKMRDLESVCRSEKMMEINRRSLSSDKEKSQEPLKEAAISSSKIDQTEITSKIIPKGLDLNLNADNKSISPRKDPLENCKTPQLGYVSECGSTTGNNDPMRVWKEMKQNGFLSSPHVSIHVPKKRGRKPKTDKTDEIKKKMDLAKKEQVDRFVKIAAPSGLLNDLNPGIINHVRNRKQVHSIIEGLVKLEKKENHEDARKDDHFGVSKDGFFSTSLVRPHTGESLKFGVDRLERDGNPKKVERWFLDKDSFPSLKKQEREGDVLALKLASSTVMASEGISCLSNEESASSSLSLKGATVAFQWLELLQQDIKGRLAALRRSKNRVRSVISTELSFLVSREFSGNQENDDGHIVKDFVNGCSYDANAKAHRAKWSALFDQMDKSLSEEEKQLENWSHQVKEMQLQCQKGLHQFHPLAVNGSQTNLRLVEVDKSERELAIRAAAASIYSTCNFMSSSENLPCY